VDTPICRLVDTQTRTVLARPVSQACAADPDQDIDDEEEHHATAPSGSDRLSAQTERPERGLPQPNHGRRDG